MTRTTWLDSASGWLASVLHSQDLAGAAHAFTPQQQTILKEAFQQCFAAFAKEVGTAVGDKLVEIRNEIQGVKNMVPSGSSLGEETTAQREVTSQDESKRKRNQRRKLRRKRTKEKHCV